MRLRETDLSKRSYCFEWPHALSITTHCSPYVTRNLFFFSRDTHWKSLIRVVGGVQFRPNYAHRQFGTLAKEDLHRCIDSCNLPLLHTHKHTHTHTNFLFKNIYFFFFINHHAPVLTDFSMAARTRIGSPRCPTYATTTKPLMECTRYINHSLKDEYG